MQNIDKAEALRLLNAPNRLENLRMLVEKAKNGELPMPETGTDVNNHIHTTFSFSPYSPTAAAWFAWQAGLCTAGLMDHDSIAGAAEFIEACDICGIGGTIGIEVRVSMKGTPFNELRINNPDQNGCMYTAMHAVPHNRAKALNDFFAPLREKRNERNIKMVNAINGLMKQYDIELDFQRDVLPLSEYANGGTVTERHISRALAEQMIAKTGGGQGLLDFIKNVLKLSVPASIEKLVLTPDNPHLMYDLLGWIKSELISQFYVDADEELLTVPEFVALADELDAISAHAYLGDVIGQSITGDKKTQSFEDAYLDDLLAFTRGSGYKALTFGPSRNTPDQVKRLRALCDKLGFMTVSGEDINTPRQSFVCVAQRDPSFADLAEAAWALIAHERLATEDPNKGMFSVQTEAAYPDLKQRVAAYARMGKGMVKER